MPRLRQVPPWKVALFTAVTISAALPPATPVQGQTDPSATPAEAIIRPDGFHVELLYSVPNSEQGSWVNLTYDPQGRLITSDQGGSLYRVTPGEDAESTRVEQLDVPIGQAQGLLYAFDSLYVVVNGNAAEGSGLYRLFDRDGDDQFEEIRLLRRFEGGGEHGPHAVILSPDGKSLYLAAGNHTKLTKLAHSSVPRNWQEDQLLPRMWDAGGHAVGRLAPGGWICRTDPEGKEFELISMGYRNEYDIAFNLDGDLFTYDADMEWDIGSPWYRPTRVCHVTGGSEFGWRSGTGKWPPYYPDSLPAAVDIGPGSPTGIVFGTGAKFPAKYQRALFVADWSYGLIYAVHLQADGATYGGEFERFATASPLPVTDLVVNPVDGALYFTIGGRRTQSGLYRLTYVGSEPTEPVRPRAIPNPARELRRRLERLQRPGDLRDVDLIWPHLSHADRFVRYAARVALEHQPVERWSERALGESNPVALRTALIALARRGDATLHRRIIAALGRVPWSGQAEADQLALLRAYALVFIRLGTGDQATRRLVLERFDEHYPASRVYVNRELSALLTYLDAPNVVGRTLDLLAQARTQEEQIHYVLVLRTQKQGWDLAQRRAYFSWFQQAGGLRGGHSFSGFLRNIRDEAIETLNTTQKQALAPLLEDASEPIAAEEAVPARAFVQRWSVADLLQDVESGMHGRNMQGGRDMFAAAACFRCHRFDGEGGIIGPDLTGVGKRFTLQYLLESLIDPSKTVSDQYQSTVFVTKGGQTVIGKVANLSGGQLSIITNMLEPGVFTKVQRSEIEEQLPSPVSMMPTGLLDTLEKDEILDLIAYLRSGGNPQDPAFQPATSRPANPAMQAVQDEPGLPRVLLIGDSISIGYTAQVRQQLQGVANVHRPLTNCGPTLRGLEQIEQWVGEKPWDVIHFNWGLHDLKYMGPNGENLADPSASTSRQQVPPKEYERNLGKLVSRLRETGATLIWCATTPVPTGAKGRVVGDSEKYNQIAAKIMRRHGIAVNDLYQFALPRLDQIQRPANVHFTPEGSQQLADQVVRSITAALRQRRSDAQ